MTGSVLPRELAGALVGDERVGELVELTHQHLVRL